MESIKNKELLQEIILDIKLIRNELQEIKKIIKINTIKSPRPIPEVSDKINGWFWAT